MTCYALKIFISADQIACLSFMEEGNWNLFLWNWIILCLLTAGVVMRIIRDYRNHVYISNYSFLRVLGT